MTRKDNLIALRNAVAADIHPQVATAAKEVATYSDTPYQPIMKAFGGDMNAALAFVAEVLPGWFYLIGSGPIGIGASVTEKKGGHNYSGEADTPARALLIAALNALIEMEQDT